MYIKEDLSVNNTQHVSQKNLPGLCLFFPLSSNQSGTKGEPLPLYKEVRTKKGVETNKGRSSGHQSTSIIRLSTRNESEHVRLRFLALNFFFK